MWEDLWQRKKNVIISIYFKHSRTKLDAVMQEEWKSKYISLAAAVFRKLWSIKLCHILNLTIKSCNLQHMTFFIIKMHIIEPWLATQNQKIQNLVVCVPLWNCIRLRYVMSHILDVICFFNHRWGIGSSMHVILIRMFSEQLCQSYMFVNVIAVPCSNRIQGLLRPKTCGVQLCASKLVWLQVLRRILFLMHLLETKLGGNFGLLGSCTIYTIQ